VAEPQLMPTALGVLSGRLQDLAVSLYNTRPAPPEVFGDVQVDPPAGDPGTARIIRLSLRNGGTAPVTLTFPTTQMYDLILLQMMGPDSMWTGPVRPDSSGCPGGGPRGPMGAMGPEPPAPPDSIPGPMTEMAIWNWAYGRGFPTVLTTLTLAPGEVRSFEETWDGRGNLGQTVGSGGYELVAAIPADIPVFVSPARVVVNGDAPSGQPLAAVVRCDPLEGPPGTARTLTLLVTNLRDHAVEIGFPTSQRFDFVITGPWMERNADGTMGPGHGMGPGGHHGMGSGEPPDSLPQPPLPPPSQIWQWSNGQRFTDQPGVETWAPGETKTFVVTWDGSGTSGTVAGPGVYDLAA
jgi:hypothetical protein